MMQRYVTLMLCILALVFVLPACSDDDSPIEGDDDHFEAVGLFLRQNGQEVVRVENNQVTGAIALEESELSSLISINFLLEDGGDGTPEDEGHSLGWEIADTDIAEIVQHDDDGKWRFHVRALEHGNTTIVFRLLHNDHADYVSPPIEIQVTEGEGEVEAVGLVLLDEDSGAEVLRVAEGKVTGSIVVAAGTSSDHMTVRFLSEDGSQFTPSADEHSLELPVANGSIAEAGVIDGEPFTLSISGKSAGETSLQINLLHEGHTDFESPAIPISVTE